MHFVEVDGARIAATLQGAGPDLVLIHAGVADRRMWDPLIERVGDRFPGHALRPARVRRHGVPAGGVLAPARSPGGAVGVRHRASDAGRRLVRRAGRAVDAGGLLKPTRAARHRAAGPRLVRARSRAFGAAEDAALEAGDVDLAVEVNVEMWAGTDRPTRRSCARCRRARSRCSSRSSPTTSPSTSGRRRSASTSTSSTASATSRTSSRSRGAWPARSPTRASTRSSGAGHLPALESARRRRRAALGDLRRLAPDAPRQPPEVAQPG